MIKFKLRYLVYRAKLYLYILSNKRVDFESMCSMQLDVLPNEVSYFSLSANTITIINQQDNTLFFRDVWIHTRKSEYFKRHIERFLALSSQGVAKVNFKDSFPCQTLFSPQYVDGFGSYLNDCMVKHNLLTKIIRCNYICREAKFSLWDKNKGRQLIDETYCDWLGLPGLYKFYPEIAPLFLSYMSGSAYSYIVNTYNNFETFFAMKSIPSYVLARQLGQKDLVSKAEICKLKIGDNSILGVLSPCAPGMRGTDSMTLPSPEMQRDLSKLAIIDLLCMQQDHLSNNYNIINRTQMSLYHTQSSVCAFDNDNMFTFFPIFNVKKHKPSLCSCIITDEGTINMPYMDKELAETILSVSANEIAKSLKPFLNRLQVLAFKSRYKGMQNAIRKTITSTKRFLLDYDEWDDFTVAEELTGKYGETYFCYLYHYINNRIQNNSIKSVE